MKRAIRSAKKKMYYLAGRFLLFVQNKKTAIIVMVDGGLGSTIWKYCIGKGLEKYSGLHVKYDLTWFEHHGMDMNGIHARNFDLLKVFPGLDFDVASSDEICFYKKYFYTNNAFPYKYNEIIRTCKRPAYIDGYFENWKYLDFVTPEIRDWFDFSAIQLSGENRIVFEEISSHPASICVHVRRGDYVNTGLDILGSAYYLTAMEILKEKVAPLKPKYFFFSNDPEWVEKALVNKIDRGVDHYIVKNNNNDSGFFDLLLIAAGKHQIAANSSFGFLGGYLNRNSDKIVVIPDVWLDPGNKGNATLTDSETAHRVPGFYVLDHKGRR